MDSFSCILHCIPYYVKATKIWRKKNALKRHHWLLRNVVMLRTKARAKSISYVRSIIQVTHMGLKKRIHKSGMREYKDPSFVLVWEKKFQAECQLFRRKRGCVTLKQIIDSFSCILHWLLYYVKATKIEKKMLENGVILSNSYFVYLMTSFTCA